MAATRTIVTPFCFSAGSDPGSVIIETICAANDDLGPRLIVGGNDALTLLMVTLAALEREGDPEKIEAARRQCREFEKE
jgi:hypothetical protein